MATKTNDAARATAQGWFQVSGTPNGAWEAVCAIADAMGPWWFRSQIEPVRYFGPRGERALQACAQDGVELADRALASGWQALASLATANTEEIAELRPGANTQKRIALLRAVATLEEICSAD